MIFRSATSCVHASESSGCASVWRGATRRWVRRACSSGSSTCGDAAAHIVPCRSLRATFARPCFRARSLNDASISPSSSAGMCCGRLRSSSGRIFRSDMSFVLTCTSEKFSNAKFLGSFRATRPQYSHSSRLSASIVHLDLYVLAPSRTEVPWRETDAVVEVSVARGGARGRHLI